jgi:hypothetical protein
MAMSHKLLRPKAGGVHPEAAAWATRVVANGGSVSGTTLSAVSKFCASIASAGIRDRFFRLNLFCGTGLSACLVPLYRGQSLGGTQYGGTTDTNVSFVSGDYSLATGLTGNGSSKYLQAGVRLDQLPAGVETNGHLSAYVRTVPNSNAILSSYSFHSSTSADRQRYELIPNNGTFGREIGATGPASPVYPALQVSTRSSGASLVAYHNGVAGSELTSSLTPVATGVPFTVFCRNLVTGTPPGSGTYAPTLYFSGALGCYSIGSSMTASQVSSYTSAINTLMAALGRNV